MSKTPSADELMEAHLSSKSALASVPAEAWLARAADVFERPEIKTALTELAAISEVLSADAQTQVGAVLNQFVQAGKVLPQIIQSNLKPA